MGITIYDIHVVNIESVYCSIVQVCNNHCSAMGVFVWHYSEASHLHLCMGGESPRNIAHSIYPLSIYLSIYLLCVVLC